MIITALHPMLRRYKFSCPLFAPVDMPRGLHSAVLRSPSDGSPDAPKTAPRELIFILELTTELGATASVEFQEYVPVGNTFAWPKAGEVTPVLVRVERTTLNSKPAIKLIEMLRESESIGKLITNGTKIGCQ
jgi:hypothetical protein